MRLRRSTNNGLILLSLLIAMLPSRVGADDDSVAAVSSGSRSVVAGDVFEILGVGAEPGAKFDWVLTADGSFVEAGREKEFRTRFTREGDYTLDGQITDASGIRRLHLSIAVTAPLEEQPMDEERGSEASGLDIVSIDALHSENIVRLHPESRLLTMTPSTAFSGPISGDLFAGRDSDGDGDPGNDDDLGDTLFSIEHNPLQLWFASSETDYAMVLGTEGDDGIPIRQYIAVITGSSPIPAEGIDAGEERHGTVSFSFRPDDVVNPAAVVKQWRFGDGWQSMEDNPIHTYINNGRYDVTVTVREMTTGHVLAGGEGTVDITDAPAAATGVAPPSASASSAPSSPKIQQSSGGASFFWTLAKILGVLLAAAALGAGSVWGLKKIPRREGALQKVLEAAESKLLTPVGNAKETSSDEPAAMQLKRPDTSLQSDAGSQMIEEIPASDKTASAAAIPSAPSNAPAPAWLQKGLNQDGNRQHDSQSAPDFAQVEPDAPQSVRAAPEAQMPPALQGDVFASEPLQAEPPSAAPAAEREPTTGEDDLLPPWLKEPEPELPHAPSHAPSPPPPPAASVSVSTPSLLQAPSPGANDQERLDRERERKRRKRQRYRENVKKRKDSGPGPNAPAPSPKPVAKDIPPAQQIAAQTPVSSDDKVAFMIKAEGLENKNQQRRKDQHEQR